MFDFAMILLRAQVVVSPSVHRVKTHPQRPGPPGATMHVRTQIKAGPETYIQKPGHNA